MIERNVQVGDIVKMNPFRLEEANRYDCEFFEGESVVTRITISGNGKVQGSNNWKREFLLIKGVDYA